MPHLPFKTPPHSHLQRMMDGMAAGGAQVSSNDACCSTPPAPVNSAMPAARRAKLSELDANVLCSIVGTCLTTAELRKLMPRHAAHLDRKQASDLDIHHAAVELASDGGAAAKELHKALDTRHALTIKRFKAAADETTLRVLWSAALTNGDVPGAYWALMTHPDATIDLRRLAFGDVHMLSHLVGASNRADIRRLAASEEECVELKEQNGRQHTRMQEMSAQHEASVRKLEQQLAQLNGQCEPSAPSGDEVARLRDTLADGEQKLALHTARRSDAERKLQEQEESMAEWRAAVQRMKEESQAAHAEIAALEQALTQALTPGGEGAALPRLNGRCVLYVGGRPGAAAVLRAMVAAAGGELLVHDGGIEDRRGLLAAMLPRAQMVVFPVDCISHNAMHITKLSCARLGIECHPLRTASVASFVELMQRLATSAAV